MPLTGHSQKENLLSVHYAARGMAGVFFCLAMPNSTAGMPAAPAAGVISPCAWLRAQEPWWR